MIEQDVNNVVLFGPRTGKSLLRMYPELNDDPDFKIGSADLLFAWYMGIAGSPVDNDWPESSRLMAATERCFPTDKLKRQKYAVNDIPDEVKKVIRRFENMSPDARLMAKNMAQKTFKKFQSLLNVDVEKDFTITRTIGKGPEKETITETDWTGRKAYVDSATKIIEALPELVKKIEEGFGITEKQKKEDGSPGNKSIDVYHKNKQQRS